MNINKYIEYMCTKLKVKLKEKKFISNGYEIKYILEENKSEHLVVIFSSCTRPGIKARYNYNRTLKSVKANKLFILDNYGDDGRGVFYLGTNNDFMIQKAVKELVKKVSYENECEKITYVGSSKGGYAALYFGLDDVNSSIVIGAPQYYLGNYLNCTPNMNVLKNIIGNISNEKIENLNLALYEKIQSKVSNNIYIHFSTQDHTYEEHIKYLLRDLDDNNIKYNRDVASYSKHSDVSIYFPRFLVETVTKIVNEKNQE